MYKVLFYCSLLLSLPFLEARRSGGGGGGMRGSSGARTNSQAGGGFNPNRGGSPNQGGGFQQPNYGNRPAGGFQQQPNYGNQGGFHGPTNTGFQRPSNFNNQGWNRSPGFSGGTGLGSASRGSTFKYALAGAALGTVGGLLAFEAGKAIINSATSPFHHQGRDYYFDQENYRGRSGVPRCSVPLSQIVNTNAPPATPVVADGNNSTLAPEVTLQNIQFRDGTKPREVVWSCNMGEICCGTDCCPAPPASPNSASGYGGSSGGGMSVGWIALIIVLVLLMVCCLGCFCVYKFCYSAIQGFLPNSQNNPPPAYDGDKYDYQGQPSQSYPMNPYPNQGQNQYPNQYPAQQQYPAQNYPSYPQQPGRY